MSVRQYSAFKHIPSILSLIMEDDYTGYEIVREIKKKNNGQIQWPEAAIYPVLKMLVRKDLISSYWVIHEDRPRKYYTIRENVPKQLTDKIK